MRWLVLLVAVSGCGFHGFHVCQGAECEPVFRRVDQVTVTAGGGITGGSQSFTVTSDGGTVRTRSFGANDAGLEAGLELSAADRARLWSIVGTDDFLVEARTTQVGDACCDRIVSCIEVQGSGGAATACTLTTSRGQVGEAITETYALQSKAFP